MNYIGNVPSSYEVVERTTNNFEHCKGNYPFVAYNLGDSKILICDIQKKYG